MSLGSKILNGLSKVGDGFNKAKNTARLVGRGFSLGRNIITNPLKTGLNMAVQSIKKLLLTKLGIPIIGAFLIVMLVMGAFVSSLEFFGNSFNDFTENSDKVYDNNGVAILDWLNTLKDDDISLGNHVINKDLIRNHVELALSTIVQDAKLQIPIKQTVNSDGNVSSSVIGTEPYTVAYSEATEPYMLPWQLLTSLYVIREDSKPLAEKLVNDTYSQFPPYFIWSDLKKLNKVTVTKVVKTSGNADHNSTSTTITTTEKEYPLPYLLEVYTYNKYYKNFYNKKYDKKSNTTTSSSTSTHKHTSEVLNPTTNKKETIVTTHNVTTTTTITTTNETWDWEYSNTIEADNSDKFKQFLALNKLTSDDLNLMILFSSYLPNGAETSEGLKFVAGDTFIDDGFSGIGEANGTVPTIQGKASRQDIANVAKSLLTAMDGTSVPYFWGGKSNMVGVNPNWGKLRTVTASGSWATGKQIPYGMDCSGYVDWVYYQYLKRSIGGGTAEQFRRSIGISERELQVGDLGFYANPNSPLSGGTGVHVGIFIGRDTDGVAMFIHDGGRTWRDASHPAGQVIISKQFKRYNGYPASKFLYFRRPAVEFTN